LGSSFRRKQQALAAIAAERKALALEEKLWEKDEVIDCLAREVLALKKTAVA
jgi:hypothetical protein